MSDSIEKFFWSESPATQAKIDAFIAARSEALAACRAFTTEVGASRIWHNTRGQCTGVDFEGETPAGWTGNKRHLREVPVKNSAAGKELSKRMFALTVPVEEDYFLKDTVFMNYWCVFVQGNQVSFPTARIAKRKDGPGRLIVRCRMLPGDAPKREKGSWSGSDTQYESDFVLPDGFNEWKEWEMLKWVEDFNAAHRTATDPAH